MSTQDTLCQKNLPLQRPVLLPARLSSLFALRRQRAQLARLDSDRLEDLGLSREKADLEARRPFWDVPRHWQR